MYFTHSSIGAGPVFEQAGDRKGEIISWKKKKWASVCEHLQKKKIIHLSSRINKLGILNFKEKSINP